MISLVMATYNGSEFLFEQLESIREQSRLPDEVIICDDNSTDNTVEIIKKFISTYHLSNWFLYENEFNKGFSANFSDALRLANGEVIFLADQDDIWLQDKIEMMSAAMEENGDILLLASNVLPYYSNPNVNKVNCEKFGKGKMIKLKFSGRWIKPIRPGCSFAFRRELLNDYYKFKEHNFPHDCILWALAVIKKGAYLYNANTLIFRRHNNNASNNSNGNKMYRLDCINNEISLINEMLSYLTKKHNIYEYTFLKKQLQIYEHRYEIIKNNRIFKAILMIKKIRYYGRPRYWLTDLYYILHRSKIQ